MVLRKCRKMKFVDEAYASRTQAVNIKDLMFRMISHHPRCSKCEELENIEVLDFVKKENCGIQKKQASRESNILMKIKNSIIENSWKIC